MRYFSHIYTKNVHFISISASYYYFTYTLLTLINASYFCYTILSTLLLSPSLLQLSSSHIAYYSLFIAHYSPLTTHHSSLITHQAPSIKHQASSIKHQASSIKQVYSYFPFVQILIISLLLKKEIANRYLLKRDIHI